MKTLYIRTSEKNGLQLIYLSPFFQDQHLLREPRGDALLPLPALTHPPVPEGQRHPRGRRQQTPRPRLRRAPDDGQHQPLAGRVHRHSPRMDLGSQRGADPHVPRGRPDDGVRYELIADHQRQYELKLIISISPSRRSHLLEREFGLCVQLQVYCERGRGSEDCGPRHCGSLLREPQNFRGGQVGRRSQ